MGRRLFGGAKKPKGKPKPRKVYDLITTATQEGADVFVLIEEVKERWKEDLHKARIGASWMIGKKGDKDGRIVLGRLKKCSELERQVHDFDAILLLNQEHWRVFNKAQRLALVHHELCHLAPAEDANGDQAIDGHGVLRWRTVKHDIEEFRAVVGVHGSYKADLTGFVEALLKRDPNLDLFDPAKKTPTGPRPVPVKSEEQPIGEGTMPLKAEQPANGKERANDPCPLPQCAHTRATHAGGPCRAPGCNCWGFGETTEKPAAAPAKPAAKRGKAAEAVA